VSVVREDVVTGVINGCDPIPRFSSKDPAFSLSSFSSSDLLLLSAVTFLSFSAGTLGLTF